MSFSSVAATRCMIGASASPSTIVCGLFHTLRRKKLLKLSISPLLLATGALMLITAPGAHAQTVFSGFDSGANSTDPRPNSIATAASFDAAAAAIGSVNLINFESSPVGAFSSLTPVSGVTVTGSDFFSGNQTIRNSPSGSPDRLYGYNTTAGGSKFLSLLGGTATFTFLDPINAFGAYFTGVQLTGETITFNDGSSKTVAIPNPGGSGIEFVGFTDAGKFISSVTITATGDIIGVDDVRFGRQAPSANTPEGSSLAMMALGGLPLAIGFGRKFRRKTA